jgi:hypothetical protein
MDHTLPRLIQPFPHSENEKFLIQEQINSSCVKRVKIKHSLREEDKDEKLFDSVFNTSRSMKEWIKIIICLMIADRNLWSYESQALDCLCEAVEDYMGNLSVSIKNNLENYPSSNNLSDEMLGKLFTKALHSVENNVYRPCVEQDKIRQLLYFMKEDQDSLKDITTHFNGLSK